ncbi:YicC/YloC family endoribonuclease [Lachnoclostridium sp. An138]|uniref:YicC/YloC family endoribonuclease n=1 Tax=Lachnoclostridium sp. An138 TaxID=1965560 RepID=UPI000B36D80E|nr:YicC/YloC family endoribonuclease [Lachnoclostridium sp. An138]OUQ20901.1 YicC family protein [Lachnoclostridium sp. An138]
MVKSMTGFGRCEISEGDRKMTVEMKSVNHRYLDVAIKMPKKLNFFESAIRSLLKTYIQRGKVDVFITYEDLSEANTTLRYNQALAAEYLKYLNQMAEEFHLEQDVKVSALSRYPEVLVMEEVQEDEEELWKLLEKAVKGACEQFVETRIREGENLKRDLLIKLDELLEHVAYVEERSPQIVAEYREKLTEKVKELLADTQMEESRIAAEVTIYADKICVDEEIVRLKSHIKHTKETLEKEDSVGRKLDFIAQEMNREANTILSKANDLEVSNHAIELKTGIEKVREQIQNIE